jgi:drug/metabolite transporter (DMT)-like permease
MDAPTAERAPASGELLDTGVFALLTLIWGTTWAAIRVALQGIPPLTGVAIRFALAGLVLLVVARLRGVRLGQTALERRLWWVNAATTFAGSYSLVYWAEQWVPSGLAAVLFATFPIWVVLLGRVLLPAERVGAGRTAAVLVGFAGVAVIFSEDFAKLGGADVRRASAVLLAAPLISAFGSVCLRRWGRGISPLSLAAVPMLLTGAGLGGVAAIFERGQPLTAAPAPWLATLYLSLFGSALTFTLYFWLLARRSALFASLISYTVPVVAVAVGWLFLDEPVTARVLAGGALVLVGVALVVGGPGRRPGAARRR